MCHRGLGSVYIQDERPYVCPTLGRERSPVKEVVVSARIAWVPATGEPGRAMDAAAGSSQGAYFVKDRERRGTCAQRTGIEVVLFSTS